LPHDVGQSNAGTGNEANDAGHDADDAHNAEPNAAGSKVTKCPMTKVKSPR